MHTALPQPVAAVSTPADPAHLLSAHLLRVLSVEAGADPRTVARVIRGGRARGMVHDRIVEALARRGISLATTATT